MIKKCVIRLGGASRIGQLFLVFDLYIRQDFIAIFGIGMHEEWLVFTKHAMSFARNRRQILRNHSKLAA